MTPKIREGVKARPVPDRLMRQREPGAFVRRYGLPPRFAHLAARRKTALTIVVPANPQPSR